MLKRNFYLAVSLSVILSSCTTPVPAPVVSLAEGNSIATQAPQTIAKSEQLLTVAHLAVQALGQNIIANTSNGLLHGDNAKTAGVWFDKAVAGLAVADAADKTVNAQGISDALSGVYDAISKAQALIPKKDQ